MDPAQASKRLGQGMRAPHHGSRVEEGELCTYPATLLVGFWVVGSGVEMWTNTGVDRCCKTTRRPTLVRHLVITDTVAK
jgi:hypothetical protein